MPAAKKKTYSEKPYSRLAEGFDAPPNTLPEDIVASLKESVGFPMSPPGYVANVAYNLYKRRSGKQPLEDYITEVRRRKDVLPKYEPEYSPESKSGFAKGGKVKPSRGDGIAKRGRTKGRFV